MDDKRKRKRQLLTDSELKKGAMKGARYKRKTPDLLDASSLEERDISRKGKPSTAEWLCRIRGAKRGSTRAAARSAILRHLATANRRIKRMAEWGTPGPQMPHPSLWPHIDRGAEFLLFRRGAKYSRTCGAHVWCARARARVPLRRPRNRIKQRAYISAARGRIYFPIFRAVFLRAPRQGGRWIAGKVANPTCSSSTLTSWIRLSIRTAHSRSFLEKYAISLDIKNI
jgi:hypothetical protein